MTAANVHPVDGRLVDPATVDELQVIGIPCDQVIGECPHVEDPAERNYQSNRKESLLKQYVLTIEKEISGIILQS